MAKESKLETLARKFKDEGLGCPDIQQTKKGIIKVTLSVVSQQYISQAAGRIYNAISEEFRPAFYSIRSLTYNGDNKKLKVSYAPVRVQLPSEQKAPGAGPSSSYKGPRIEIR